MGSKNVHKLEPMSWSRRRTCVALMPQGGTEHTVDSVEFAAPTRAGAGRLPGFSALFADNKEVHELHLGAGVATRTKLLETHFKTSPPALDPQDSAHVPISGPGPDGTCQLALHLGFLYLWIA